MRLLQHKVMPKLGSLSDVKSKDILQNLIIKHFANVEIFVESSRCALENHLFRGRPVTKCDQKIMDYVSRGLAGCVWAPHHFGIINNSSFVFGSRFIDS